MAKKLDPVIADVLKTYGFGADAAWDCHGTWVVYHRVLEQIAAKAGITYDPPQIIEANGPAKSAALCVTGYMGGKGGVSEWSIGEAAPGNNKNSYPYAMAEKRAKDRVILKLIGLHGLAYSEDEADDFKASASASAPAPVQTALPKDLEPHAPTRDAITLADTLIAAANMAASLADLEAWGSSAEIQAQIKELPTSESSRVRAAYKVRKDRLLQKEVA